MSRAFEKLVNRRMRGLCLSCGHKPCTCRSKGRLRNRIKGIGRNEAREPSRAAIAHEAKLRTEKKDAEANRKA